MSTRRTIVRLSAGLLAGLIPAAATLAHGEDLDVGVIVDAGSLVTVGASDEMGGTLFGPERVWASEIPTGQNFIDEPGFFALAGTFAPGTTFGFNIVGSLKRWNDGLGDFEETDIDMVFTGGAFGAPGTIFAPASGDAVVPGFSLDVDATGGFDAHAIFNLSDPSMAPGTLVDPGVWLINLSLFADGFNDSLPFSVVINSGGELFEAQHEAAIERAEQIIPAPGACSLMAFAGLAAARRRRR